MTGEDTPIEAVILVKAAAQPSKKEDATVYSIGVTKDGQWLRIFPVTFRKHKVTQSYKRWDSIRFTWDKAKEDPRPESRRIDPNSIELLGDMPYSKRRAFITSLEATSLTKAAAEGKTLVLLKPRKALFTVKRKTEKELAEDMEVQEKFAKVIAAADPHAKISPTKPFPYVFKYRFWTDDAEYESPYRDWEMQAVFNNLANNGGEAMAIVRVIQLWGKEYLHKGILFAMSRDTLSATDWVINGVICVEEIEDMSSATYAYNVLA